MKSNLEFLLMITIYISTFVREISSAPYTVSDNQKGLIPLPGTKSSSTTHHNDDLIKLVPNSLGDNFLSGLMVNIVPLSNYYKTYVAAVNCGNNPNIKPIKITITYKDEEQNIRGDKSTTFIKKDIVVGCLKNDVSLDTDPVPINPPEHQEQ